MNHPLNQLKRQSLENAGKKKNGENVKLDHSYEWWKDDFLLANTEERVREKKRTHASMVNDTNVNVYQFQTSKRVSKEQSKEETRREMSRQRSKANRERNKDVVRRMQEQIDILTAANEQLCLEGQMQRREMRTLRNICGVLPSTSNYGHYFSSNDRI